MNRNATITFFLAILFAGGSVWFYLCKIRDLCDQPRDSAQTQVISSSISESIVFEWEDSAAMRGRQFDSFKVRLMADLQVRQLEIIGLYDSMERNFSTQANLGLARALSIRAIFPELPDSQFIIGSERTTLDSNSNYFLASKLNIIFGQRH